MGFGRIWENVVGKESTRTHKGRTSSCAQLSSRSFFTLSTTWNARSMSFGTSEPPTESERDSSDTQSESRVARDRVTWGGSYGVKVSC